MPDRFPSKLAVRGPVRFQIPADLVIHAAFIGRAPEIDPTLADPMVAAAEACRENPWSPTVLSAFLRQAVVHKAMKMNKPEISAWLKKQGQTARRRLAETHTRIAAARERAA
jgi:hypothetical protein